MTNDKSGEYSVKKAFSAESATNGYWGVGEPLVFEIDMLCATLSCAPSALRASISQRFPDPTFATLRETFLFCYSRKFAPIRGPFLCSLRLFAAITYF
jgi:hypothetical protein